MIFSEETCKVWTPRILSVMRIIMGFLFLQHGTAKLLGFPHVTMFDNLQLASLIGVAGILELVGGSMILVGLFTRPVAFILSGEMAVAYFMVHAQHGWVPMLNQGELAVIYCFVFLYLSVAGGGVYGLDAMMRGKAKG